MKPHFLLFAFLFISLAVASQKKNDPKIIEVVNSNGMIYSKKLKDAQRLIGDVILRHDGTVMYCDSAMLFTKQNRFQAYGHIHVKRGDTLNLFGDSLHYFAKNKLCRLWNNIRLVEKDLQLVTDSIQFDGKANKVWYNGGATITSIGNGNKLKSKRGVYYSSAKTIYFSDQVELEGKDYTMTADTLEYHTVSEVARFHGPTVIRTEESTMYCEAGWYDTKNETSFFRKNAFIHRKEHFLKGDTIMYDRKKATGVVLGNMELKDTLNDYIIQGGKADFNETTNYFMVTNIPLLSKIIAAPKGSDAPDDTLFLYADTLEAQQDTVNKKSWLKCYHRVKFFKSDLQGKCDSMYYSETDSLMYLLGSPVLWAEGSQLTAEKIQVKTTQGSVYSARMENLCFMISKADSVGYHQVKGRVINVWLKDNEIRKARVEGNGQTVYYAGEKGKPYKGMNKTDCSDILLYFSEDEPSQITFITKPDSVFYPMNKINPKDKFLKDFLWLENEKPTSKNDLFPVK